MKITFLGTAAAEGIPAPFCDCATCNHARQHKGRNVRKRQTLLVNDDLLIDIGPDLFASCGMLGISLVGLKYLLVTHSHGDHFYAHNLEMRLKGFRLANELPQLTMVAGPSVLALWGTSGVSDQAAELKRIPFLFGRSVELPPYSVRAIEASHIFNIGDAMNYIIDDGRTKLLFASDTGMYQDHVWKDLEGSGLDVVVMEATLGTHESGKAHLSFKDFGRMTEKMREIGAITDQTRIFATHFSHQGVGPHDEIEAVLRDMGVVCAYDGLTVEF